MGVPSVTGPGPEAFALPEKNAGGSPGGRSEPVMAIVRGQLASPQAKLPRETYPPEIWPMSHPPATDMRMAPVAYALLGPSSQLQVTGVDAVGFIENFTTNKVGDLAVGGGCDSFFCDARGAVLDLALVRRPEDGLLIDVGPDRAATLRNHLDRYHIREQLCLTDVSGSVTGLALIGAEAEAWLRTHADQPLPTANYQFRDGQLRVGSAPGDPVPVRVTAIDWYGPGSFLLEVAPAEVNRLIHGCEDTGVAQLPPAAVTSLRLQERWPVAVDIPEKTLPQELGLDARALCFTKGCYLGQETVARLDALGHVNRSLVVLAVTGDDPVPVGAVVAVGGEPVAAVTSVAPAGPQQGWLAMAIVPLKALQNPDGLTVADRSARTRPTSPPEPTP